MGELLNAAKAEKDPAKVQSQLIDAQREDFNTRFLPLENKLMDQVSGNGEKQAKAGMDAVHSQQRITRESFVRDLGRSGTQTTARQRGQIQRKNDLSRATNVTNVKNQTRRAVQDENTKAKGALIGIGRGVQQSANEGLSAAAGMQANREQAGRQAKQQQSAQNTQMVATGIGLIAAMFI